MTSDVLDICHNVKQHVEGSIIQDFLTILKERHFHSSRDFHDSDPLVGCRVSVSEIYLL